MEYIIMWLGTIAVSTGMKVAAAFKLIKNIADCGYKLDTDRVKELTNLINPMDQKLQKIINLIPVCNMFFAMYIVAQTSTQTERIMDALRVMNALEEMTDKEQGEYNKNRSAINAIKIMSGIDVNKSIENDNFNSNIKVVTITSNENGDLSATKIFGLDNCEEVIIESIADDYLFFARISYLDGSEDFVIKEIAGSIENLPYEEQKEKIKLFLKNIVNRENSINEKKEQFEHVSRKISEYEEQKETDEKSTKEKLQKLRQEISQYTEEQNKNKDSKGKPYIKK